MLVIKPGPVYNATQNFLKKKPYWFIWGGTPARNHISKLYFFHYCHHERYVLIIKSWFFPRYYNWIFTNRCPTCSKRFSQLSILQSHMASHANQRCHLCELCGKSFRQKSQMKTHLLRHKGDEVKKYSCQECSMLFLTSSK